MPSTLPCPNPVCTHLFNADAVRGAASVACPRCGTKLEFRAPAAPPARTTTPPAKAAPPRPRVAPPKAAAPVKPVVAPTVKPTAPPPRPVPPPPVAKLAAPPPAKPAAPPLAAPVAAPPVAQVVAAPAVPLATPVTAAPPPGLVFNSQPDMLLTPRRRRRGLPGWLIALFLVVGVFGGMAALIFGAILNGKNWWANPAVDPSGISPDEKKSFAQQGNFHIEPPGKPWERDTKARLGPGMAVAYRRSGPASFMALVFRDYQTRLPRESELIEEGLTRLHDHLLDDKDSRVEYEVKPKDDQLKLGGQLGVRFDFACTDGDHVPVRGECVATAYRGVAYWFFTWAPVDEVDKLRDEWSGLRATFALDDKREGWTEKPPNLLTAQGNKLPYKLEYVGYDREKKKEGLWEKQELDAYDPHADLVLLGYDPKDDEPRSGDRAATVQVLALSKAADLPAAVKEGKDALLEIEKDKQPGGNEYLHPNAVLDTENPKGMASADTDMDVGSFKAGHLLKREAKLSADRSNYVVLAVVRMDSGDVLAVVCECTWDRRDLWEQEFTTLLAKLRPKGK